MVPLNQMDLTFSVALYILTLGRGLTQPWCEPSPWGDQTDGKLYLMQD